MCSNEAVATGWAPAHSWRKLSIPLWDPRSGYSCATTSKRPWVLQVNKPRGPELCRWLQLRRGLELRRRLELCGNRQVTDAIQRELLLPGVNRQLAGAQLRGRGGDAGLQTEREGDVGASSPAPPAALPRRTLRALQAAHAVHAVVPAMPAVLTWQTLARRASTSTILSPPSFIWVASAVATACKGEWGDMIQARQCFSWVAVGGTMLLPPDQRSGCGTCASD